MFKFKKCTKWTEADNLRKNYLISLVRLLFDSLLLAHFISCHKSLWQFPKHSLSQLIESFSTEEIEFEISAQLFAFVWQKRGQELSKSAAVLSEEKTQIRLEAILKYQIKFISFSAERSSLELSKWKRDTVDWLRSIIFLFCFLLDREFS